MAHWVQDQTGLFTASEVEARTGVLAVTLRQWERRYGFPRPARNGSGYRLYSPRDLADIQRMQALLGRGVPASRAAELTQQEAQDRAVTSELSSEMAAGLSAELTAELTAALLAGPVLAESGLTPQTGHSQAGHSQADAVLARAQGLLPTEDVLLRVICPTLVELGERWERGDITVAHEHQASAFVRERLSALMLVAAPQPTSGPLVVAACAPGEHHELGLMMLTLALRRRGVRVAYLGANVPLADLSLYARQVQADALAVALNGEWALASTRLQLSDLHDLALPVFYGGALLNQLPELAQALGGQYAGPDATQAADYLAWVLGKSWANQRRPDD